MLAIRAGAKRWVNCAGLQRRFRPMYATEAKDSDHELVVKCQQGSAAAFGALVERHQNALKRRIEKSGWSPEDADDIVQEVLIKAWKKVNTFRFEAAFPSWLTSIARNQALETLRQNSKAKLHTVVHDEHDELTSNEPNILSVLCERETATEVHNAVRLLPKQYRPVIPLRDLRRVSVADAARELGMSTGLVKLRQHRGRKKLAA